MLLIAALGAALAAPTVVDLQPEAASVALSPTVSLTNLAPAIGRWYLLRVGDSFHHLENPDPLNIQVSMTAAADGLLHLTDPAGEATCSPWLGSPSPLDEAAKSADPYFPLCGGRLWRRKDMRGQRSPLEWSVEQVRDRWRAGEKLTELAKATVYKDRYLEQAQSGGSGVAVGVAKSPPPIRIKAASQGGTVAAPHLQIPLIGDKGSLPVGKWVPAASKGVWISGLAAGQVDVDPAVAPSLGMDTVEARALVLMVGFDLSQFDLDYELGTDHPRVEWAERVPSYRRINGFAGPDGFSSIAPLTRTGQVPPWQVGGLTAAFTGGFKRTHGAFKSGPYASHNNGSHYGFIQDGVIASSLNPGLATLIVWKDGTVEIRTWTEADAPRLRDIRHARQNGVSIVQRDEAGQSRAGPFVDQWGAGNWSGSAEGQLRSLRASACIIDTPDRRFLVYAWFSSATPAGMARVLLSAGCTEAMLLDMNALEHTYLAVYTPGPGDTPLPHHIDDGMKVLDKTGRDGNLMPRFVALPDNRDFFMVIRKTREP